MGVQWKCLRTKDESAIAGRILLEAGWPHARVVAIRDVAGRMHDLYMHRNVSQFAPPSTGVDQRLNLERGRPKLIEDRQTVYCEVRMLRHDLAGRYCVGMCHVLHVIWRRVYGLPE